ncbi:MAG: HEAT repeat domain-containing protein [Candidatus Schekmanbacteria bacterium]|nr:HEAT repeat domain-containing protein [Candidatus Schekmanbacteria bacterium]
MRKTGLLVLVMICLMPACTWVTHNLEKMGLQIDNTPPKDEKEKLYDKLVKNLYHSDYIVRKNAAAALGAMKTAQAVSPLIDALRDKNEEVRLVAAEALVQIGQPAIVPLTSVIACAGCPPPLINITVLTKIGAVVIPSLVDALKSEGCFDRQYLVSALINLGKPAVDPLLPVLLDKTDCARKATAYILGEIGDQAAIEPLLKSLKDESPWVREAVVVALTKIDDPRRVEPIIQALWDENEWVNKAAAYALQKIATPLAINPLITFLKLGKPDEIHQAAAEALISIGPPATEPLLTALYDKDERLRKTAADCLERLNWEPLRDVDKAWWLVTKHRMEEAGELEDFAIAPLVLALRNKDWQVRRDAMQALKEIGLHAVDAVIPTLKDEDKWVRQAGIEMLKYYGDERAIDPINDFLVSDASCMERRKIYHAVIDDFPSAKIIKPMECPDEHFCEICGKPATYFSKLVFKSLCETHRVFCEGTVVGFY